MPKSCVAVGCHNHNMKEGNTTFHVFPKRERFPERWAKWVNAVKRVHPDGSKWQPKGRYAYICSDHFVTKKPNDDPQHPDHVPSLFKHKEKAENATSKMKRYYSRKRRAETVFVEKKKRNKTPATPTSQLKAPTNLLEETPTNLLGETPTNLLEETPTNLLEETPTKNDEPSTSSGKQLETPTKCSSVNEGEISTSTESEEIVVGEPLFTPTGQICCSSSSFSCALEMSALRGEKLNLRTKIQTLEEQVLLAKYNPKFLKFNDEMTTYFTGLSWNVFDMLVNYLCPFIQQPRTNLPKENQVLMVLVRLRLNLQFEYLSYQTGLAQSTIFKAYHKIIDLLYKKITFLVKFADRDNIFRTMPPHFKQHFPKLTCIIDCFEIFIDRPRNLRARAQVYSNYKKHSTIKHLISCTPTGCVNFISGAYGGRASDVQIVRESGFMSLNNHMPGDQILADRGFTLQDDFAATCSAELIIPAFTKGKNQLSPKEVETTRKIASVRIHIERVIGLIKNRYTILKGPLPITFIKSLSNETLIDDSIPNIDKLLKVCAALINLSQGNVIKNV